MLEPIASARTARLVGGEIKFCVEGELIDRPACFRAGQDHQPQAA